LGGVEYLKGRVLSSECMGVVMQQINLFTYIYIYISKYVITLHLILKDLFMFN